MYWVKSVLLPKQLGSVLLRLSLAHAGLHMAHMCSLAYKLEAVLIAGDNAAVPAGFFANLAHSAEKVVRFIALEFKAQDAHIVKHLLQNRHLHRKFLRHTLALRLVAVIAQMAECRCFKVKGHTDGLGLFTVKQLLQNRQEAVNAVCRCAVGRIELPNAVKCSVNYAVSV